MQQSVQIKTVLIHFYGNCNDIDNAKLIFDCIDKHEKNIVNIGAMMNVYINNKYYSDALELYDITNKQKYIVHDNVTNILAIKACGKTMNLNKRKQIHNNNINNNSIQFKNSLTDFYGKMNCIDIGCMMNA